MQALNNNANFDMERKSFIYDVINEISLTEIELRNFNDRLRYVQDTFQLDQIKDLQSECEKLANKVADLNILCYNWLASQPVTRIH